MLGFFLNEHNISSGITKYTQFNYIQNKINLDIYNVKKYLRKKEKPLNNTNILSKIMDLCITDPELDIFNYNNIISQRCPNVGRTLGLTSSYSRGIVHINQLYANNSFEIINYIDNGYNIFNIEENWRDMSPITLIYTDYTNIDYHILDGTINRLFPSLTVIDLDVRLMVLMYKYWALERLELGRGIDVNIFLTSIVLPNAINNMSDMILFNRYLDIFAYRSSTSFRNIYPFFVSDVSSMLDIILKKISTSLHNTPFTLEKQLDSIPTISGKKMTDILYLDRPVITTQNKWSIIMSRIKYIDVLLELLGYRGIKTNRHYVNTLKYELRSSINEGSRNFNNMPKELRIMLRDIIKDITEQIS